jgi:hypothetical protein
MVTPLLLLAIGQKSSIAPTAVLVMPSKPVAAGSTFKATLNVEFKEGLHGYQNPPTDPLEIPVLIKQKSGSTKLISVKYPKGVPFGSPAVKVYSGAVRFTLNLKAGKTSGPITLLFNYQQCTATSCYPPAVVTVTAKVPVASK